MIKREITIRYSNQAKKLIENLKDFDKTEFENYFYGYKSLYLTIEDDHILEFIFNKNKK